VKIAEREVPDPTHPCAVELEVENLYRYGNVPLLPKFAIADEKAAVPPIVEHCIGQHPVTGAQLLVYGTYSVGWLSEGTPCWTRHKNEANARHAQLVSHTEAVRENNRRHKEEDERAARIALAERLAAEKKAPRTVVPPREQTIGDLLQALKAKFN
jgi:hypothetical protein